jgi:hypothetical protein
MPAWEVSQGLFATAQATTQDLQEILGFSESEALQGKDISGKARRERKLEGSMSAYVYFDNLNQAVEQGGRIVNDLLPYIAGDAERHMIISKADGKTDSIILNKREKDGSISNEIDKGEFDVEIDSGPSFAVQKDIALEFLSQTLQAFPQAFPLIADLWAKNLDVSFMPQMAERFKSIVPPDILAKESGEEPPPKRPDPQQMMMAQEMQMKQQQMKMNEQKMQIEQQKMQLEQQQVQERAEELAIRKQKHSLEQAEMIMKAREMQSKMGMDQQKNSIEIAKMNHEFTSRIAEMMSDIHQHHTTLNHEKEMQSNEKEMNKQSESK